MQGSPLRERHWRTVDAIVVNVKIVCIIHLAIQDTLDLGHSRNLFHVVTGNGINEKLDPAHPPCVQDFLCKGQSDFCQSTVQYWTVRHTLHVLRPSVAASAAFPQAVQQARFSLLVLFLTSSSAMMGRCSS